MQRLAFLALSLAAALAASGCSDHGDRSHLSESSWRFQRIDGERPIAGAAAMTFTDDRIGVRLGCNQLGGPWHIDADRLHAGPLAQTEVACSEKSWNQESAVGALLVATPRVAVDGRRMTLQSNGHTAELVRMDMPDDGRKGG